MNKTKNEVATQTALTVDELKKMGDMLADVRETMELYNNALNLVPHGRKLNSTDLAIQYQALYELTNTMFYMNQKIMKNLDHASYLLSENDNANEIEATKTFIYRKGY